MIKTKTAPENLDFYSRTAPILQGVFLFGIVFQIISAISEGIGIYTLGTFMGYDQIAVGVVCVALVVLVELGIRIGVNYLATSATKHIKGHVRLKGVDLSNFILVSIICGVLISGSIFYSKKNTENSIALNRPGQDTTLINNVTGMKAAELADIESTYQSRKADIEKLRQDQIKSAEGIYLAAKIAANEKITQYRKRSGSFPTQISRQKDKINKAYAVFKAADQRITKEAAQQLIELTAWRTGRENGTIDQSTTTLLTEANREKEVQEFFEFSAWLWSKVAGLSVLLAVVCIAIKASSDVEAGIETTIEVLPDHFEPSLFSELRYMAYLKILSPLRNRVRRSINSTGTGRVQLDILQPQNPVVNRVPESNKLQPENASYNPFSLSQNSTAPGHSVVKPFSQSKSVVNRSNMSVVENPQPQLITTVEPVEPVVKSQPGKVVGMQPKTVVKSEKNTTEKPKKIQPKNKTLTVVKIVEKTVTLKDENGTVETIDILRVQSRKGAHKYKMKTAKTPAGKKNAKRWFKFYSDVENLINKAG